MADDSRGGVFTAERWAAALAARFDGLPQPLGVDGAHSFLAAVAAAVGHHLFAAAPRQMADLGAAVTVRNVATFARYPAGKNLCSAPLQAVWAPPFLAEHRLKGRPSGHLPASLRHHDVTALEVALRWGDEACWALGVPTGGAAVADVCQRLLAAAFDIIGDAVGDGAASVDARFGGLGAFTVSPQGAVDLRFDPSAWQTHGSVPRTRHGSSRPSSSGSRRPASPGVFPRPASAPRTDSRPASRAGSRPPTPGPLRPPSGMGRPPRPAQHNPDVLAVGDRETDAVRAVDAVVAAADRPEQRRLQRPSSSGPRPASAQSDRSASVGRPRSLTPSALTELQAGILRRAEEKTQAMPHGSALRRDSSNSTALGRPPLTGARGALPAYREDSYSQQRQRGQMARCLDGEDSAFNARLGRGPGAHPSPARAPSAGMRAETPLTASTPSVFSPGTPGTSSYRVAGPRALEAVMGAAFARHMDAVDNAKAREAAVEAEMIERDRIALARDTEDKLRRKRKEKQAHDDVVRQAAEYAESKKREKERDGLLGRSAPFPFTDQTALKERARRIATDVQAVNGGDIDAHRREARERKDRRTEREKEELMLVRAALDEEERRTLEGRMFERTVANDAWNAQVLMKAQLTGGAVV